MATAKYRSPLYLAYKQVTQLLYRRGDLAATKKSFDWAILLDVIRQPIHDPFDLLSVRDCASGQHIVQGTIERLR